MAAMHVRFTSGIDLPALMLKWLKLESNFDYFNALENFPEWANRAKKVGQIILKAIEEYKTQPNPNARATISDEIVLPDDLIGYRGCIIPHISDLIHLRRAPRSFLATFFGTKAM